MFRLVKPTEFFRVVSDSSRLKFSLTWLTFLGLVLPTALLTSIGVREEYALPLLLVSILPFQYIAYCVLYGAKVVSQTTQIGKLSPGSHPTARDFESLARRLRIQWAPLGAELGFLDPLLWNASTRGHVISGYEGTREALDAFFTSASTVVASASTIVTSASAGFTSASTVVASASAVQPTLLASYSGHSAETAEDYTNLLSNLFDVAYSRKRHSDTMIRLQRGALYRPSPLTEQSGMLVPSPHGTTYTVGSPQPGRVR